jgi:hypothetical protein
VWWLQGPSGLRSFAGGRRLIAWRTLLVDKWRVSLASPTLGGLAGASR